MLTSSYDDWARRPLSAAVCPTSDIWPDEPPGRPAPPRRERAWRERRDAGRRHGGRHSRARVRQVRVAPNSAAPATLSAAEAKESFMNEEKLRILRLLEDGKITAPDAARLMEALEKTDSRPTERDIKKRWLHIVVTEAGDRKVNVKIPLSLLKFGFGFVPKTGAMKLGTAERKARIRAAKERSKERVKEARARIRAAKERLRDSNAGIDLDDILGGSIEDTIEDAIESSIESAIETADGELSSVVEGLDLKKILEMARDADFDGRIVDVHDGDEHVTVTLE